MTAPELSPEEAKIVARFDAAETPPEVLREQMAAALWTSGLEPTPWGCTPWREISGTTRDRYYRLADAALAVFRGQQDLALVERCPECDSSTGHWHGCGYGLVDRANAAIGGDGR